MTKLIFVANPFRLSPAQLLSLADISKDIAQVVIAGLVIEPLITGRINWYIFVGEVLLSIGLWYANLILVRKVEL